MRRRDFLSGVAAGAAVLIARPSPAAYFLRQHRWPEELLHAPLILGNGDTIENKRYRIADDFVWDADFGAIVVKNATGVTIRNVELIGSDTWLPRWDVYREPRILETPPVYGDPPGHPTQLSAILAVDSPYLTIDNVQVRGFCRQGLESWGIDHARIRGLRVRDCFAGIFHRWMSPSSNVLIEDCHFQDMWGPQEWIEAGIAGYPSEKRLGEFIGSDGFSLMSLRDSVVRNCTCRGEVFGSFKWVNPINVEIYGMDCSNIMIQGTADETWTIDAAPASGVHIHDCVLNKSYCYGSSPLFGNCFQISWNQIGTLIERCKLVSAGTDGHGIQLAGNSSPSAVNPQGVSVVVRDCAISGFNQYRGDHIPGNEAAALNAPAVACTGSPCTFNADFGSANSFVNQTRIIRL